MTYVLAVSGGVDSVVLLDMFAGRINPENLVVAHFEHGIRGKTSKNDALFVKELSQKYRVKCEIDYGDLTKNASEDLARRKRYDFLKSIAAKYSGQLVTAHHQDDLIETIAINLYRGTGWRGLAVFGDKSIARPLVGITKENIYNYALRHNLEWVEDETNLTSQYLRNRLRGKLNALLSDSRREGLVRLHQEQTVLADAISNEIDNLAGEQRQSRYFFIMTPEVVAIELLRDITDAKLTRPQLERLLISIKTLRPGSTYEAGSGVVVEFTKRHFVVINTSRVV